jgi:hypothetical protein
MFEESAKLLVWLIPIFLLAVIILPQMIRILREYERGVIFRLGKLLGTKGLGLIFLIPIVDRMVRMDRGHAACGMMQSIFRSASRREALGKHSMGRRRDAGLKMDWTKPLPRAWPMCIECRLDLG